MLEDGEEIYYTLQRQDDCTYMPRYQSWMVSSLRTLVP